MMMITYGGIRKKNEVDNDEEEYDRYGIDDELLPWNMNGRLGRQRMRKLGKRVFSKIENLKKNPYLHVKPSAIHGKHGLVLRLSLSFLLLKNKKIV